MCSWAVFSLSDTTVSRADVWCSLSPNMVFVAVPELVPIIGRPICRVIYYSFIMFISTHYNADSRHIITNT